ncbi:excalibur calcium-binding domain-containing protein [Corynebacterium mastitidis]|uniref:excalibur calcium-binding domain-containing protein n=1 Tax=Corynebacterium mastitidis TaxID=161890 RepID=UPI0024577FD7|nr:excalibur calcium-binding domain-containing protein [Corynebacterium mastitidis]
MCSRRAPFRGGARCQEEAPASTYYSSCAQAKAAGAAPLYAGSPGYSSRLDRDGDGVACEN